MSNAGGAAAAAAVAAAEKSKSDIDANAAVAHSTSSAANLVVNAAASVAAPSHPPRPTVDLAMDSPRENRVPSFVPEEKQAGRKETRDETVAIMTMTTAATTRTTTETTTAAAAAAPRPPPQPQPQPQPPPPPPLPPPAPPERYLTLADVTKPPDLVALPWLNPEIKLDR